MAPAKSAKTANEDSKGDSTNGKERNGHAASNHTSNGKLRRVGSSTGSLLREVTNAGQVAAPTSAAAPNPASVSLQWSSFDREVLHAYRRAYRLNTPTAFSNDYHLWVLSQPGGIGLHSPTMARRKELRRQSKESLAGVVRKHFNGLGVQENEIIVDFLHKIRSDGVAKSHKLRRGDNLPQITER